VTNVSISLFLHVRARARVTGEIGASVTFVTSHASAPMHVECHSLQAIDGARDMPGQCIGASQRRWSAERAQPYDRSRVLPAGCGLCGSATVEIRPCSAFEISYTNEQLPLPFHATA